MHTVDVFTQSVQMTTSYEYQVNELEAEMNVIARWDINDSIKEMASNCLLGLSVWRVLHPVVNVGYSQLFSLL